MKINSIYLIVAVLAGTTLAKKAAKRDKPKPTADPVVVEPITDQPADSQGLLNGPGKVIPTTVDEKTYGPVEAKIISLEKTPTESATVDSKTDVESDYKGTAKSDGTESDAGKSDEETSGGRMLDITQQSQYTQMGSYGNNPYGGSQMGGYGNTGQVNYGMTGGVAPAGVPTYGAGQYGNYANMGQSGFGMGMPNLGLQPPATNVVPQQESFRKVEYANTPTVNQPVNPPVMPPTGSFGSFENYGNMGLNMGMSRLPSQPVTRNEELFRTDTQMVDDGKPVSNFSAQFGNPGIYARPTFGALGNLGGFGMGQIGSYGGMGQIGSFGGMSHMKGFDGFGGFGGMMNPMMMNQFSQVQESSFGGNEEVGVRTPSDSAYPVPMPIPFHMPQPQPFPVPVHTPFGVPIPVPHPYPVEKAVEVRVPVHKPVPYPVHNMVPIPVKEVVTVNKPYPVHVPVDIEKPVKVEVPVPFQQVKVPEPRPYPVHIRKNVPVPMPFPVPVPQPDMSHKMMC